MSDLANSVQTEFTEDFFLQPPWSASYLLEMIDIGFRQQLTADSPKASQPAEIALPLRDHQKALIAAMRERESNGQKGIQFRNTITQANQGVLGDEVGSGKSLTILAQIAMMKNEASSGITQTTLMPHSRSQFFSVIQKKMSGQQKQPSLIIIPHPIQRQWQDQIKKQTKLNIAFVKSRADIPQPSDLSGNTLFSQKIRDADAVLVSNTLQAELEHAAQQNQIQWQRIFVDEVDSIHIPSTSPKFNAPFVWLISATWPNFLLNGCSLRQPLWNIFHQNPNHYTPALYDFLSSELGAQGANTYRSTQFSIRSQRQFEPQQSSHALRTMVLLTCRKDFLNASRQMPIIHEETILCLQPMTHRALQGIVSSAVQNMLHGGNLEGALQALGVSEDTPLNLVDAVTREREKELDRLKKTLQFKESIEQSSEQGKELALNSLKAKIASVEAQLKTIRERILSTATDECPICQDDPKSGSAMIIPCCHRVFCAQCILQSLTRNMTCPMCRTETQPSKLVQLVSEKKTKKTKKVEEPKLLSKPKQLLKFIEENPTAKILVFNRQENPFVSLESECAEKNITQSTLRGNKDVIASTMKSFENGDKRVLFLPTESMGAGLNLISATHVVLMHAMTPEEEKQAIGRAYRLGRTADLKVVRLLHEDESLAVSNM